MAIRLASHLAGRHAVTLMYPIVAGYTWMHRLRRSGMIPRFRHVIGSVLRYRRALRFQADLDTRVKIEPYFLDLPGKRLREFDVVIYQSVWQYHELKKLKLPGVLRIHWVLADYLFAAGIFAPPEMILEAYLANDVLVAPSSRTRRDLESYGATVTAVIGGGIDAIFTDAGRQAHEGQPSVLGYYQPSWWVKGGSILLQVVRRIRVNYPDVRIELLGHQPSDIGASASFCDGFHTGLQSVEVAKLYRQHDVFLYPSFSDGFPSPPLEAMACGCAVVATRVGAVEDYATDGTTALLCHSADVDGLYAAVVHLIINRELRERLVRAGGVAARGWKWEDVADKFDGLIARP